MYLCLTFNDNPMKKVLITGAGSYVGESVKKYILTKDPSYQIDTVDTMADNWKQADYSLYDVILKVSPYLAN